MPKQFIPKVGQSVFINAIVGVFTGRLRPEEQPGVLVFDVFHNDPKEKQEYVITEVMLNHLSIPKFITINPLVLQPDDFGVWIPFYDQAWIYPDYHDIRTSDGVIHRGFRPNVFSWSGFINERGTIHEMDIVDIRLCPVDYVTEHLPFADESARVRANVRFLKQAQKVMLK